MFPSQTTHSTPTLVPQDRRAAFLPALFGRDLLIEGEKCLQSIMESLSPEDTCRDTWEYYELDGEPLYFVPTSQPTYRLVNAYRGYDTTVTSVLAGIIITLFAVSGLTQKFHSEQLPKTHARLYAFAMTHPNVTEIFAVID